MPYTFVNFILQIYTCSRAEGEAIVSIAVDLLTTSERPTPRMAHNECSYLARGTTMLAERLPTLMRARRRRKPHGARRSVATERPRGGAIATEQPNDKHPAWLCVALCVALVALPTHRHFPILAVPTHTHLHFPALSTHRHFRFSVVFTHRHT